jgi:putative redox protein
MRVEVRYKTHLQFQAIARGHEILSDQPLDNGGDDAGMTPPEWFLASLGSCAGFYVVKYLQTRGLDAAGLSIDVSAQKTTDSPARLDDIEIRLSLPIVLEDRHQQGLRKAVEVCIVHNTLMHPPRVTTQIAHTPPEMPE